MKIDYHSLIGTHRGILITGLSSMQNFLDRGSFPNPDPEITRRYLDLAKQALDNISFALAGLTVLLEAFSSISDKEKL